MSAGHTNDDVGSGNSHADTLNYVYPDVPYSRNDFNLPACHIENSDWGNAEKVSCIVLLVATQVIKCKLHKREYDVVNLAKPSRLDANKCQCHKIGN